MRAPPGAEAPGYATTPGEPGFGCGLALKAPLRGRLYFITGTTRGGAPIPMKMRTQMTQMQR